MTYFPRMMPNSSMEENWCRRARMYTVFFTVSVATMLRLSACVKAVSTFPCGVCVGGAQRAMHAFTSVQVSTKRSVDREVILILILPISSIANRQGTHAAYTDGHACTYDEQDLRRELDEVVAVPLAVELCRVGRVCGQSYAASLARARPFPSLNLISRVVP